MIHYNLIGHIHINNFNIKNVYIDKLEKYSY